MIELDQVYLDQGEYVPERGGRCNTSQRFLTTEKLPEGLPPAEREKFVHQVRIFLLKDERLLLICPDGTYVIVGRDKYTGVRIKLKQPRTLEDWARLDDAGQVFTAPGATVATAPVKR